MISHAIRSRSCRKAFSLIELLIVVAIIGILISLLFPTFGMISEMLVRTHCANNLRNCHSVLFEYASNYGGVLPPFTGGDTLEVIQEPGDLAAFKMPIPVKEGENPFMMVELLKYFGGSPGIFTCPAHPNYSSTHSDWKRWYITSFRSDEQKQVRTPGYVFYIATWQYHDQSGLNANRDRYHTGTTDGRALPKRVDEPGTLPLAADRMGLNVATFAWSGFNHRRGDERPGGGGHTLFLSGAVQWADWSELEAEWEADPPTQPYWPSISAWNNKTFCRRYPKSEN